MAYLIDGYNLLFALLGVPPRRQLKKGLERARRRLLTLLASHASEPSAITLVFDAADVPRPSRTDQLHEGLHVVFSARGEQADDVIEDLIRRSPTPRKLTVVSDDHRLQKAARARRCAVLGCADYLNELESRRASSLKTKREPSLADEAASDDAATLDKEHWLQEFADLADDRALKELFDPLGLDKDAPD
jgi:predicted RNA-binding protein with PIN domain